ncbi:Olfactory receptor, insect,DHS-like NAD/FAD-binding domain [Cinara cedri]|uniref:Odorant receptor n=1 Tax=Cinara cedri TaxID=506608 RepID=A0A5E4M1Q0_9HEMI|nr:Olfactory receptor, insect,DHS-like NAD/FAD-binding domain [Cinara cedri]
MSADLRSAIRLCRLIGLFPPGSKPDVAAAYRAYQVLLFAVVSTVTATMTIQLFIAPELDTLARTIDIWTMCLSGLYKWYCLAVFVDKYRTLHGLLDRVRVQAEVVYGPSAHRFMANHVRRVGLISNVYGLSGILVAGFLSLGAMYSYPKGNRSDLEYFNDPKSYPLCCWMPFTVSNYWVFSLICVLHFLVLLSAVFMYLLIDTYMFGAIFIMGGQFELLNEILSSVRPMIKPNYSSKQNKLKSVDDQKHIDCCYFLSQCINYHSLILKSLRSLQDMFNTLIIFDYLHGITSLTFAMFQTTISSSIEETISLLVFISISIIHQYLNNFFGEYIIQKQLNVQRAAYDFPWLFINKKSRQLITMLIFRSNKPLIVTGFYMYELCFKSFLAFVKALYTYYMVLRKVNQEEVN